MADLFPGSAHVRQIGLRDAADSIIWDYARQNGFAIVSKDSNFQFRSLLYGRPPKFIWLRAGNCSVKTIQDLLRHHAQTLLAFDADPAQAHLILP